MLVMASITMLTLLIIQTYNSLQYMESTPMYSRLMAIAEIKFLTLIKARGTHTHRNVLILFEQQAVIMNDSIMGCLDIWVYNKIPP